MTVYAEVIFLDNFLLDTLLLWLASRFAARLKLRRILAGGLLGGAYAVLASLSPILAAPLLKFTTAAIISAVAFRRNAPRGFLYFMLWSVLLGGAAYALSLLTSAGAFSPRGRILLIAVFIILIFTKILKRSGFTPPESVTVEADFGSFSFIFAAEYDSGCCVKDKKGNAAILIDRKFAEKHMASAFSDKNIKTCTFGVTAAVGRKTLIGLKPHQLHITDNKHSCRADAWIVIADDISLNGCPAIFGKGLFTESEETRCRQSSGSIYSNFSRLSDRIAATISTAAKRFRRRSPRKRKPPC